MADKQTPDPLTALDYLADFAGVRTHNEYHRNQIESWRQMVRAVIRAAQDEDSANVREHYQRVMTREAWRQAFPDQPHPWRDPEPGDTDRMLEARARLRESFESKVAPYVDALAAARADLAAHHDTRPGREQQVTEALRVYLRAYALPANVAAYLAPEDTHDTVAERLAPLAADAVLALLGPTPVPDVTFDSPITVAGVPAEDRRTCVPETPRAAEQPHRRHSDHPADSDPVVHVSKETPR